MSPRNPYELLARQKKALELVHALEAAKITPDEAAGGTDAEWALAAKVAGTTLPSPETRRMVVEMMRSAEVRSV